MLELRRSRRTVRAPASVVQPLKRVTQRETASQLAISFSLVVALHFWSHCGRFRYAKRSITVGQVSGL